MSTLLSLLAVPSTTTILVTVAAGFLLYELYRRFYLTFDDNVPTIPSMTFINRPPLSRIEDMHQYDLENVRKLKSPVVRYVQVQKPWSRSVIVGDPAVLKAIYTR